MSESNICERCGGYKTIYYKVEALTAKEAKTALPTPVSDKPFRICMCPLPREKHDGKLDEKDGAAVHMIVEFDGKYVEIVDGMSSGSDNVWLKPSQALSLLAWLKQEEAILEQLAQEVKSE